MIYEVVTKSTTPYEDQKPGTSGLRKKTKRFFEEHYVENFIQCILFTIKGRIELGGCTIVVGGDGRYHNRYVIESVILPMLAANGVEHAIVGIDGLLSTPSASHLIRSYGADGGIILTASHNPGGLNADFGIKFNLSNGGPSPEKITNKIYEYSRTISEYKTLAQELETDLLVVRNEQFQISDFKKPFQVSVVNSVKSYVHYMKKIFDFTAIRNMITGEDGHGPFHVVADAMNGVMGPYVIAVMEKEFKVPSEQLMNCRPLEDFGHLHPDPNLTYASHLVEVMKRGFYDFGCAFDGDGDRNMILGHNSFFINPSDSLAIVADNLGSIPYFKRKGILGVARSMPTSSALDKVAAKKGLKMFEVPTGWKFFGNLMDTNQLSLCGEESFGMGSNHIREKDGLWAILAWLSVIAAKRLAFQGPVSLATITFNHWGIYGRNFYTRYDYEGIETEQARVIMIILKDLIKTASKEKIIFKGSDNKEYKLNHCDDFMYRDSVDDSLSENQGIRLIFLDESRIIYRLSGTGSEGATLRVYVDSYESDPVKVTASSEEKLKPLIEIALQVCRVQEITGREGPTVIT